VNDSTSGVTGGLLSAAGCYVGKTGTGALTQSGGNVLVGSLQQFPLNVKVA